MAFVDGECNMDIFKNITLNCQNDLEVIKDNCKVICLASIVKGLDMCYFSILDTGLMNQFKSIIKWCYYKKEEATTDNDSSSN